MLVTAIGLLFTLSADPSSEAPSIETRQIDSSRAVELQDSDRKKDDAKKREAEERKKAARDKKAELPSANDKDDPALAEMAKFIRSKKVDTSKKNWRQRLAKPPQLTFSDGVHYFWNMETNKGVIKIKLMPDVAPMHVSSTIYLSRLGFYDDLKFHRVINGFMAQGGCPTGTGTGSPGYKYAGEFDDKVKHDRPGLLSMANAGPDTDGSQFFITFVPTPHLNNRHTIFGEVVEGMEAVRALEKAGSRSGRPSEALKLVKTTISIERAAKADKAKDEKKAPKKRESK